MTSAEATNVGVVRKYFDGCNTGELTDLMATLTPDVVHYFLPDRFSADHRRRASRAVLAGVQASTQSGLVR